MESHQKASLDALIKFLPIMDDFERAMENVPEDLKDNPWFSGISLLQGKFKKLLEEYDVEEVIPTGELFDPNMHQAIGMDESDEVESGHVTATLQKGYSTGERILRPALVRVAN
jgi:molecular chaperone GrpE